MKPVCSKCDEEKELEDYKEKLVATFPQDQGWMGSYNDMNFDLFMMNPIQRCMMIAGKNDIEKRSICVKIFCCDLVCCKEQGSEGNRKKKSKEKKQNF